MNVANHYATQEYTHGAMARFDAITQLTYQWEPGVLTASKNRKAPISKKPLNKLLWKIIAEATYPIDIVEMYESMPRKYDRPTERAKVRALLCTWSKRGWLQRFGEDRHYTYKVVA